MNIKLKNSIFIILTLFISIYSYTNIKNFENFTPSKYYKADTDGDGIIDIYDSEPTVYNVTDRDLRFFQEITYRTPEEIKKLFNNDESYIEYFNREKLMGGADVREITKNWTFVEQVTADNGFQASIFKNGNQAVLAIAGTNDANDTDDDAAIVFATTPGQGWNAEKIINEKMQVYSKYYITGHSLGGYLTMYAGATSAFKDSKFIHGAVFNSPGLNLTFRKDIWSNSDKNIYSDYTDSSDKRNVKTLKKIQAYGIHGDSIAGIKQIPTTKWNNQVTTSISNHSSTNFVATKNDKNFREWFSTGYRLDNPYLTLDTDGDGILDVDELKIGTDYTKFDSDGDGFSDKLELAFSTNPTNINSKPPLSTFYKAMIYGGLVVNNKSEITKQNLESRVLPYLKQEYTNYTKHIPNIMSRPVSYVFENLPSNLDDIKDYIFKVKFRIKLPDGSYTEYANLSIRIEENKVNENRKENEIYEIKGIEKLGVYDKDNLEKVEKDEIEKRIREANKDIPKKLRIIIEDNGNVFVVFEDLSQTKIDSEKVIYQRSMNETFKLKEVEKTGIENLSKLTENEKTEIEEKIRKSNKNPRIKSINVKENGTADITFVDDTVYSISSDKLTYQSLVGLKELIVSAEAKFLEINNSIDSTSIVSPLKKEEIDKEIEKYNELKNKILEKISSISGNVLGLEELKERNNKLVSIKEIVVNDYNSNDILDEKEINKGFDMISTAKSKLSEYQNLVDNNSLIDNQLKLKIDNIVDEYTKQKESIKEYIDKLTLLKDYNKLNLEFNSLKDIKKLEANDKNSNKILDEIDYTDALSLIKSFKETEKNVVDSKEKLKKQDIISVKEKENFDLLYNKYETEKSKVITHINDLGEIDKSLELKNLLKEFLEIKNDITSNDLNSNNIDDKKEIEEAKNKLEEAKILFEKAKNKKIEIEEDNIINDDERQQLDEIISEYKAKKQEAKIAIESLGILKEKAIFYEDLIKLYDVESSDVNDRDKNKIDDTEEISLGEIKIEQALNSKNKALSLKSELEKGNVFSKNKIDNLDILINEYNKFKEEAKIYVNGLGDIPNKDKLLEKLSDLSEIDSLVCNDCDSNGIIDEEEINIGKLKLKNIDKTLSDYENEKTKLLNSSITKENKEKIDSLIKIYENLKQEARNYINSLGDISGKQELLDKLNQFTNLDTVEINDYDSNGIVDKFEIEKAYQMIDKLKEIINELDLEISKLDIISPNLKKEIDLKINSYHNEKNKTKEYVLNLSLNQKDELIQKLNALKEYNEILVNDIDDNKIKDLEEIEILKVKIDNALYVLNDIRNEKSKLFEIRISKDKEFIDYLIEKYNKLREEAITYYNNLSDLIPEKNNLKSEIDKLVIEESIEIDKINKEKLKEIIDIANDVKNKMNYQKADEDLKIEFDKILEEALQIYENERVRQNEIDEITLKLGSIIKLLNGNLNDSIKYVNLLHYTDTSITNMLYNDGLFFNIYLKKSVISYFQDVLKNEFKLNDVFGGVQIGYNGKILDNLSMGVFTEYSNTTTHNISLGIDLKNNNFIFFTRYRLSIIPNEKIFSNNIDFYIKGGHYFDIFNYFKIEPSVSIYASYMAKTNLPNNIYIDHKGSVNVEASVNMMYLNKGYRVYLNPKIKYIYDTPVLYDENGNKLKYTNNNYFDYAVSLGLEKKIDFITFGGDFTFNGNKNSLNYRFNTYFNFNW